MAEGANQSLVGGAGPQAETPAVATAHDLGHGQARHVFVRRGAGYQAQPTPALVLAQKVGQQHHHHARERVMKGCTGFHDVAFGKGQSGKTAYLVATLAAAKAGFNNSGKSLAMGAPLSGL